MIGIILCCHGDMGQGMRSAAELIVGPQDNFDVLSIRPGDGIEDLRQALKKSLRDVGRDGAVILTDIPGGTPCNVSAMFVDDKVKMITGFNLHLLLKLTMGRMVENDPAKLTEKAPEYACETIMDASFMLKGA